MLQYIINTSIVWLACLLLYELLLSKESFHQFNRIFLLASLVIGLVLPTLNLNNLMLNNSKLLKPTEQMYEIKKVIQLKHFEQISTPIVSTDNNLEDVLWVIYFAGILVGIVFIALEVFTLFKLYINGSKSVELGCTIVETEKNHCPFSFLNIIFIRRLQDYSEAEWMLLINHEKEHKRQLHLIDNLLLIMLRIICWFNPLTYFYYKRLRIVHEFQADQAAAANTFNYGTFLLEQNLLQGAPILTHSFNYSPIKTRIAMLTRTRSTQSKLLKYLTVFPLLLILIIFCTQSSFSGEVSKRGSKTYFKGNEIEFGELKVIPYEHLEAMHQRKKMFLNVAIPDSFPVKDWTTGQIIRMDPTVSDVIPVAINGKPIYGNEARYLLSDADGKYVAPVFSEGNNFDEYIFSKLKKELDKLEDGNYTFRLNRMVIDHLGNLAYYENEGIALLIGPDEKKPIISDAIREGISKKLVEVLNGFIKFEPGSKDGKPVNVRLSLGNYLIVVKGHKASLVEGGGC